MHGWKKRILLKHHLERGASKTELSRQFGVSRRTIHQWVEKGSWTETCQEAGCGTGCGLR